jgi:hypothetical protein
MPMRRVMNLLLSKVSKQVLSFAVSAAMLAPSVALATGGTCNLNTLQKPVKHCLDEANTAQADCKASLPEPSGDSNSDMTAYNSALSDCQISFDNVKSDCDDDKKECGQDPNCSKVKKTQCLDPIDKIKKQLTTTNMIAGSQGGAALNIAKATGIDPGTGAVGAAAPSAGPAGLDPTAGEVKTPDPVVPKPLAPPPVAPAPVAPPPSARDNSIPSSSLNASTTSGNSKSSGGLGGLGSIGSILGAAAPAAMMMMMMRNNQMMMQTQAPNGYATPDGVFDTSANPNCGATYAYRYDVCDQQVSAACMSSAQTMINSPVCQQFSARYCNLGYDPTTQPALNANPGCPWPYYPGEACGTSYFTAPTPVAETQVDIVGVGNGTAYCMRADQIAFCASASNASCPSCMQLQSLASPTCANNPSCNVQSSPTLVSNQLASCPNPSQDPLVAYGMISSTGTALASNLPITAPTTINGGAPPPVLPASAGGLKVASIGGYRGPASRSQLIGDVAPQYGQSLFNASSAPVALRCQRGSLNHCLR